MSALRLSSIQNSSSISSTTVYLKHHCPNQALKLYGDLLYNDQPFTQVLSVAVRGTSTKCSIILSNIANQSLTFANQGPSVQPSSMRSAQALIVPSFRPTVKQSSQPSFIQQENAALSHTSSSLSPLHTQHHPNPMWYVTGE